MKRLLALLIAASLCLPTASSAWWQSIQQVAISGGGGGSPTFTPGTSVAIQHPNFGGTTATFSNLNNGVSFPSGATVIVFFGGDQGATTLTTPLIGGQTATLIAGATDSTKKCQAFSAVMPASEPDTFSFGNGNGFATIGVTAGYFTNVSGAPTGAGVETFGAGGAGSGDPQQLSAPIAVANIGMVGVWASNGAITSGTATWTSTTSGSGDMNAGPTNGGQVSSAHTITPTGSWNPKVSSSYPSGGFAFSACMSAASY